MILILIYQITKCTTCWVVRPEKKSKCLAFDVPISQCSRENVNILAIFCLFHHSYRNFRHLLSFSAICCRFRGNLRHFLRKSAWQTKNADIPDARIKLFLGLCVVLTDVLGHTFGWIWSQPRKKIPPLFHISFSFSNDVICLLNSAGWYVLKIHFFMELGQKNIKFNIQFTSCLRPKK